MSLDESPSLTPRSNPDLIGHNEAERTLLDAACSGKLPHAWLVTGREGIGKATLCYRFAKFLLSNPILGGEDDAAPGLFGETLPVEKPESMAVDPDHPVAQRVTTGAHGDLKVLERQVNEKTGKLRAEIVIDDIRKVGQSLTMTTMEGGWRVVIIDAAEDMNRNAANALLKDLEEPPEKTVLMLVSHAPGRLLPTIRSRCRMLSLSPLDEDVMTELLKTHAPDLPSLEAKALISLAEGSIGRALQLHEQGGAAFYQEVVKLLALWPNFDVPTIHALGERLAKKGEEEAYDTFTRLFKWWLGRFIAAAAKGEASQAASTPEEQSLMARLAGSAPLSHWLNVWDRTGELLVKADSANLDKKQVIIALMAAMVPAR